MKSFGLMLEVSCGHVLCVCVGAFLVLSGVVSLRQGVGGVVRGWVRLEFPRVLRSFLAEKQGKEIEEPPSTPASNPAPPIPLSTAEGSATSQRPCPDLLPHPRVSGSRWPITRVLA